MSLAARLNRHDLATNNVSATLVPQHQEASIGSSQVSGCAVSSVLLTLCRPCVNLNVDNDN